MWRRHWWTAYYHIEFEKGDKVSACERTKHDWCLTWLMSSVSTLVLRSVCIMFQGLRPKTLVSSMSDLACCTPPVSKLELVDASIVAGSATGTCSRFVKQWRWPGGTDEQRFDCEMKNTPGLPLPIPPQKREDTRTRTCQIAVQNLTWKISVS
jgi:hypothetical protein